MNFEKLSILRSSVSSGSRSTIVRGSFWLTAMMLCSLGLQAGYFVVIARLLGPVGFGTFSAGLALVNLLSPFSTWGAGNLLVRDGSRHRAYVRMLWRRSIIVNLMSGGCLYAVIVVLSTTVYRSNDLGLVLLPLGLAELLVARWSELSGQAFQALDRLGASGSMQVILSAWRLAGAVALGALTPHGLIALWSWLYLGTTILAAGCAGLLVRLGIPRSPTQHRPLDRWSAADGFFFSLGSASKTAYSDLDKYMLLQLDSSYSSGIYNAAYRIITIAIAPVRSLVLGSNTRFFAAGLKGPKESYSLVRRLMLPVAGYGIMSGLLLFVCAPLMPILLGPSYRESSSALRWLALMPLIQGVHYLSGDALMGLGRQQVRSVLQVLTVGVNAGLNLWLVPEFSWRGAAVASMVCEALLGIAVVATLRQQAWVRGRHRLQ